MDETTIELESLAGEHLLTAVDQGDLAVNMYGADENCDTLSFTLDGKTYTAVEDPGDGYRSAMSHLFVSNRVLSNQFPPVRVLARYHGKTDDILELIDLGNAKTILMVGTHDVADYYPGFCNLWEPEKMSQNQPNEN